MVIIFENTIIIFSLIKIWTIKTSVGLGSVSLVRAGWTEPAPVSLSPASSEDSGKVRGGGSGAEGGGWPLYTPPPQPGSTVARDPPPVPQSAALNGSSLLSPLCTLHYSLSPEIYLHID